MAFGAGSIEGTLGLDISPFTKGMFTAIETAKVFPEAVGAFLANPLLGLVDVAKIAFEGVDRSVEIGIDALKEYASTLREVANAEAEAADSARALGLSVETYTALAGAAKLAGADARSLGDSMKFLNRNMADAASGNQELRREFFNLGVSVQDSTGQLRNSQDVFFDLADAIAALPNAAERTKYAMDLMGRGADGMLPFLSRGSAGIRQLMEVVQRLGAVTSQGSADASEKVRYLDAAWDLMWKGIKEKAAEPALELIVSHFDQIQSAMFGLADAADHGINFAFGWIDAHKDGIKSAFNEIRKAAEEALHWGEKNAPGIFSEILAEGKALKGWFDANELSMGQALRDMGKDAVLAGGSLVAVGTAALHVFEGLRDAILGAEVALSSFMVKQENNYRNSQGKGAAAPRTEMEKAFGYYSRWEHWIIPKIHRAIPSLAPLPAGYGENDDMSSPPSGAGSSQPSPITVHVNIDPRATGAEVAKAVTPVLQRAVDQAKSASVTATRKAAQRSGL